MTLVQLKPSLSPEEYGTIGERVIEILQKLGIIVHTFAVSLDCMELSYFYENTKEAIVEGKLMIYPPYSSEILCRDLNIFIETLAKCMKGRKNIQVDVDLWIQNGELKEVREGGTHKEIKR